MRGQMRNHYLKNMKDKLTGLVILALVGILFFQRGCGNSGEGSKKPDTLVVRDTFWTKHDSIIVRKVPVLKEIPAEPQYFPQVPADYETLKAEYSALRATHHAKRIYQDSIAVGKYGYIHVTDTVSQNALGKRKTKDDFKIPTVKETVTITKYEEPKRQVYVGGGVAMNQNLGLAGAKVGLLYKTKKDQIYGINSQVDMKGNTSFGVEAFWKINLNKKK